MVRWTVQSSNACSRRTFNEMSDSVGVYKVNVDDNTELAQEHGVQSIPTLLVFKNGALSETIVGLKTKDELIEIVNS